MSARLLGLIALAASVTAMAATTISLAQSHSFDVAYKGSLECGQVPAVGVLRAQLAIGVRNDRVIASIPIFDVDTGKEESGPRSRPDAWTITARFVSVTSCS
jgi:hypothetical protein